jgi:hypothetical protein
MLYTPPSRARPGELIISPFGYQSLATSLAVLVNNDVGPLAWPTANVVIYVPFWVPDAITIYKMFLGIGTGAGNVDVGIYADDGTRLVSAGTTAAVGSTATLIFNITDTNLARGRYYLAAVADTVTTLTIFGSQPNAVIAQALGLLQQASVTLPLSTGASPATFAKYTQAYVPNIMAQGYRTFGP